jgi:nitroreductase
MDAIYSRRSIRRFTAEKVPDEVLREFVRAGMSAPSAGNQQPWHFIIIDRRDLLEAITLVHPYAQMLHEAPAAILVCGDLSLEKHHGFWVQDCSAATENILLMIESKGYGGVWCGVHPREDRVRGISKLLGIPDRVVPLSLIAVGRPAEQKGPRGEFLEDRVHRNGWRGRTP